MTAIKSSVIGYPVLLSKFSKRIPSSTVSDISVHMTAWQQYGITGSHLTNACFHLLAAKHRLYPSDLTNVSY